MTTTYSLEDVQAMLPNGKNGEPPSVRSIKVKAKKLGVLRRVGNVLFITKPDLDKFMEGSLCNSENEMAFGTSDLPSKSDKGTRLSQDASSEVRRLLSDKKPKSSRRNSKPNSRNVTYLESRK